MAKDREKLAGNSKGMLSPFIVSPIHGNQRGHLYVNEVKDRSLSTSTPYPSRKTPPSTPTKDLDFVDGCGIRGIQRPPVQTSMIDLLCSSDESGVDTGLLPAIPPFNFAELFSEDETISQDSDCNSENFCSDNESDRLPLLNTREQYSRSLPKCFKKRDCISSEKLSPPFDFEFKKPVSSPPGSRKRLPVATVTQLHKDALRESTPCRCSSAPPIVKTDISYSSPSDLDLSHISVCSTVSTATSHNDSGYQTFDCTTLSDNSGESNLKSVTLSSNIEISPSELVTISKSVEQVLEKNLPSFSVCKEFMIGKKIGVEQVDIVSELHHKGALPGLRLILSMLEVRDLKCMCSVNQTWKRVCLDDTRTRERLAVEKTRQKDEGFVLGKENLRKLRARETQDVRPPQTDLRKCALLSKTSAQNKNAHSSAMPISPTKLQTRSEQYVHVASKLKNEEHLDKCPRCTYPAKVHKVQERGRCIKQNCMFDYCIKCRGDFHGSRPCYTPVGSRSKSAGVGTKKSKKNLRRL